MDGFNTPLTENNSGATQTPERIDRINYTLTTEAGDFRVIADLVNGEAQDIDLYDADGDRTSFPTEVLGQLLAIVKTQEAMIHNSLQRAQVARLDGSNMMPNLGMAGQQVGPASRGLY